jgi:glucose/arabinose dehydrogenase
MGDGGSGGDPMSNGQNRATLLGDLLRIDVDAGDPYAIPADNPFVNQKQLRGEIWAWGLRNPWRLAFDETAHLLYIADVGQNKWEEIDIAPSDKPGVNYGWNIMEGNHCYIRALCNPAPFTPPVLEYHHTEGCSITGGYVYRGRAIPAIVGQYFYGDYCLGWIRSLKYEDGRIVDQRKWNLSVQNNIMSFGQDSSKELYVLFANGKVYRFDPA